MLLLSHWPNAVTAGPTNFEEKGEKNHFQFVISKYHTSRQSGQTVNIYVRYAYKQLAITLDFGLQ